MFGKFKKLLGLSIAVILMVPISAMESNNNSKKEIGKIKSSEVRPYKPALSARYPLTARWLKATTAGLGSYAAAKRFINSSNDNNLNSLFIGAAVGMGVYLYDSFKNPALIDSLICNPNVALVQANSIRKQFKSEAKKSGLDKVENTERLIGESDKLLIKYEQKSPIFLLGECVKEGWGPCLLSRSYQPKYREVFEEKVSSALLGKLNSNGSANYVSFASGGNFQDLVLLTKTLALKPDAQLDVHLIDFQYTPFVKYLDVAQNNRKLDSDKSFDFSEKVLSEMAEFARKEWGLGEKEPEEIKEMLKGDIHGIGSAKNQLAVTLKKMFPHAVVNFHLHDTAESYLNYIKDKNLSHADVISTCDIQDEMSLLKRSLLHYKKLCAETLQKKQDSKNIFLTKDPYKGEAGIATLSLNENQKSEKWEADESETDKTVVYLNIEPIKAEWFTFLRKSN
ncbi:MAG TPA: hypothetical protein VHO47_03520 [Candidatus Babeliales bacterium]|nr:hypothetical protein [Candidatus Babeliales bacterium]